MAALASIFSSVSSLKSDESHCQTENGPMFMFLDQPLHRQILVVQTYLPETGVLLVILVIYFGGIAKVGKLLNILSFCLSHNVSDVTKPIFGWFKRSLNQSIGSFSTNPHFALFRPDRRLDIFGNVSNHWGMVTYTFFWNNSFGSLIRAHTGSFANMCAGTSPLYIKVGQILGLSENGSWVLVDARRFFFVGHELEHAQEDLKNWWYRYMKVGQICGS